MKEQMFARAFIAYTNKYCYTKGRKNMGVHISDAINITNSSARYDESVKGEGKIFYDIQFVCRLDKDWIKFLINVEAQKEVEFTKSDYDGMKAVRSIWTYN